jgi:hypothetical protein
MNPQWLHTYAVRTLGLNQPLSELITTRYLLESEISPWLFFCQARKWAVENGFFLYRRSEDNICLFKTQAHLDFYENAVKKVDGITEEDAMLIKGAMIAYDLRHCGHYRSHQFYFSDNLKTDTLSEYIWIWDSIHVFMVNRRETNMDEFCEIIKNIIKA